MRLLLDTHVVLWAMAETSRLSGTARGLLEDPSNTLYCSVASLWEIAIKANLNRPDFRIDLLRLRASLPDAGIDELAVIGTHIEALLLLPDHHKDPFDRILVAQAQAEPMRLLSSDRILLDYWDGVIPV